MSLMLHRLGLLEQAAAVGVETEISTITVTDINDGIAGMVEIDLTGWSNVSLTSSDAQFTNNAMVVLQFSSDGGSTWFDTSGDYIRNAEIDAGVTVSNVAVVRLLLDLAAGGTLTRPHAWSFTADCLDLAVPTTCTGCEYLNDTGGSSTDGAFLTHVMTDAVVINRMRIGAGESTTGDPADPSTWEGLSGTITVVKEKRPTTLIATLNGSGLAANSDIDVSGYSSIRIVSADFVSSNSGSLIQVQLSFDGGSVFDATSGNYKRTVEGGNTSSAANQTGLITHSATNVNKPFTMEIFNLDVAAPTFSLSSDMGNGFRWFSMHNNAAAVTDCRLGITNTGSSGTIYVIGDSRSGTLIDTIAMTEYTDPGTIAGNPNPVVSHSVASYREITAIGFSPAIAASGTVRSRISDDNGSTFETAGYSFKTEDGSNESQRSEEATYNIGQGTGGFGTSLAFWMQAQHVDLAAPMFGWGCVQATNEKSSSMVKASAPVTDFGLMWWDSALTDHVAGSSGTVYLAGR